MNKPDTPLTIAGKTYQSRLLVGTGKYRDLEETRAAIVASSAEIVTVALRRSNLAPVSFDLAAGECVAVRGPSGSGKTLLLRAIADLDPNEGAVSLDGRPRDAMPAYLWRRRVVYVPAESGWWADLVAAHFRDWSAAAPLLAPLALPEDCGRWPVLRLSTGERQRLALIRALALAPRVLLLDEPTSGLDPDAVLAVERLIAERLRAGAGALWVTHDADQARRVAARRLVVDAGRVTEA
jgi:putative ABC transport system ATP-binding protein